MYSNGIETVSIEHINFIDPLLIHCRFFTLIGTDTLYTLTLLNQVLHAPMQPQVETINLIVSVLVMYIQCKETVKNQYWICNVSARLLYQVDSVPVLFLYS